MTRIEDVPIGAYVKGRPDGHHELQGEVIPLPEEHMPNAGFVWVRWQGGKISAMYFTELTPLQ